MKKAHISALIIIAILVGYIISSSSSYSTYETFATAHSQTNQKFQVVGKLVKDKALYYNPEQDANYFSFFMTDNDGEERKVVYKGAKPQDFERSEQVVLTGKMVEEEFHASKILLKCPSKYVEDEVEERVFEAKS